MDGRTVAILGTRYTDFSVEKEVLGPLGVSLVDGPGGDDDAIAGVAGEADVLMLGSPPRITAATLARLSCRGIVRYGVGVEKIDLDAARAAGIWVARVADYGTEAVSIHSVALALAGFRRLLEADGATRAGGWGIGDLRPLSLPSASTAGVVGYGRIGRTVAAHLRALGFRVLAHDPLVEIDDAEAVPLEEVLRSSDVVSLHAPGHADGTPLLGAAELGLMREGSVLVNTARGALIDAEALVDGLRAGRPRVACLDVFPAEPPDASLFAEVAGRVIMTPHMAWYTEESELDMRRKAAEEARRLLQGERPRDVVVDPTEVTA